MTYAVRHSGTTEDLEVALWFEGADLVAVVTDRGQGFDVESVDATASPDASHVPALACLLDPGTGQLTMSSAWHPPPVHLTPSSCRLAELSFGPPLGTFATEYASDHLRLEQGDCLILYTDGVTEARHDTEMLGEARLVEAVRGFRGRSAEDIAQGVADAARAFGTRLRDDLQVVVVRLSRDP